MDQRMMYLTAVATQRLHAHAGGRRQPESGVIAAGDLARFMLTEERAVREGGGGGRRRSLGAYTKVTIN